MHDAFKLKTGNNEPIRHEWYPPHITVVDNTGEALETSSFKFRLAKKLEKQAKSMYCDKTANFEYQFNNFTEFQLDVLIVLNIFVGERNLEPTPQLAATDPNRQVEDFFTVLKFIFSTQRNSFSVTDFLISNLLLHAERLIRQSEAWKLCWNYQKRCRILRKVQILPSHFSRHLQGHFCFRKLSMEYAFGSSNTKLKPLVILVIILLFGFGPQGPVWSM